jgi:hypothetical protein
MPLMGFEPPILASMRPQAHTLDRAATGIGPYIIGVLYLCLLMCGGAAAQLVEALRYKPEGHGFDSRWRNWNFSLT